MAAAVYAGKGSDALFSSLPEARRTFAATASESEWQMLWQQARPARAGRLLSDIRPETPLAQTMGVLIGLHICGRAS